MRFNEYEYRIGAHFLSALIDADATGLSDAEEADLDAFEQQARADHGDGFWTVADDDGADFRTCDVTGMGSDTCRVTFNVPVCA